MLNPNENIFSHWREGLMSWGEKALIPWFLDQGWKIALTLLFIYLVNKFSYFAIERMIRRYIKPDKFSSKQAERKREDTLIKVIHGIVRILVWVVTILILLSSFKVDIKPILTAMGVGGLALSFGAQYLIRDLLAGLFIILENQYRIGDVIEIDGTAGEVQDITLRETVLRDLDGTEHHIPNGQITKSSNMSKSFAGINLNIGVGYETDLDKAAAIINEIGKELAKDKKWKKRIIEAPYFARIKDLGEYAVVLKILGKTQPLDQWDVMGELRKRIKLAFDKEGIEIPYPQRVVRRMED